MARCILVLSWLAIGFVPFAFVVHSFLKKNPPYSKKAQLAAGLVCALAFAVAWPLLLMWGIYATYLRKPARK